MDGRMKAKTCQTCKYFIAYCEIYEDDLEPYDIGECRKDDVYPIPSELCGIHWEDSCDNWESIY